MMLGVDDEDEDDDDDMLLRGVLDAALSGADTHDKLSSWASRRGDAAAVTSSLDGDVKLLGSSGDTRPNAPPLSGPRKPLHSA